MCVKSAGLLKSNLHRRKTGSIGPRETLSLPLARKGEPSAAAQISSRYVVVSIVFIQNAELLKNSVNCERKISQDTVLELLLSYSPRVALVF